jgi:predicted transcriptional regulator
MEFVRDEVASDQRYINAIHVEVQMAELELKRVAKDIDNIKEDMDNLKVKMDSTTTAEREKWLDSMQLENLTVRKKHLLDEKLMWLARWDRLSTLMLAQKQL